MTLVKKALDVRSFCCARRSLAAATDCIFKTHALSVECKAPQVEKGTGVFASGDFLTREAVCVAAKFGVRSMPMTRKKCRGPRRIERIGDRPLLSPTTRTFLEIERERASLERWIYRQRPEFTAAFHSIMQ